MGISELSLAADTQINKCILWDCAANNCQWHWQGVTLCCFVYKKQRLLKTTTGEITRTFYSVIYRTRYRLSLILPHSSESGSHNKYQSENDTQWSFWTKQTTQDLSIQSFINRLPRISRGGRKTEAFTITECGLSINRVASSSQFCFILHHLRQGSPQYTPRLYTA